MKNTYITGLSQILSEYTQNKIFNNEIKSLLQRYHKKLNSNSLYNIYKPNYNHENKIYSNNFLNLNDVKVIGFDLDYTLVTYTDELQKLIYSLARDNLIKIHGFPKSLQSCQFDKEFAIRGLSIDLKTGRNIEKKQYLYYYTIDSIDLY